MAATNLLFLFVFRNGSLYYFFFAAACNGAPLGAKFLADSILADIIDYDEFLTGMRSEATYFMFKSFLPKIVQIPATAMPIALLGTFGYVDPIGGKVQDQPESCSMYLRCVVAFGFIASVIAYFLKARYPLKQEYVDKLAIALEIHRKGEWAEDPISKLAYFPLLPDSQEEQVHFWQFQHFSTALLQEAFRCCNPDEDRLDRFIVGCIIWCLS
jgi:Na+/melibiose symporter-like transporter